MALYEILALGAPTPGQVAALCDRAGEVARDFELLEDDDIVVRNGADAHLRDPKAIAVALYFGGDPSIDGGLVDELEAARVPIVPVLAAGRSVGTSIPDAIKVTNACFLSDDDHELRALSALACEILSLLREQRRVFVSYRRNESRKVAIQLHDRLSEKGFDVFLDTHDIRPGQRFQEMLWHRLADCDVVIMLDTKDYFGSKWTVQEFGRTLAKGINILRLQWPDRDASRHLSLSETVSFDRGDFDPSGELSAARIDEVARRTEGLRSRSIATRHRDIAGKLRIEVERIGGVFEGIGPHRALMLTLPRGMRVWAYPAVGVPTADLLNDVHSKAQQGDRTVLPCLVYDHLGIRGAWLDHLRWLNANLPVVRTLQVMNAAWELVEWDS